MTNGFKHWVWQTSLCARRMLSGELVGFLFAMTFLLSFLTGCNADVGDQMIKGMEIAQATAPLQNSGTQARAERIEAIKRERAKNPGPIIPGLDYARIARGQALDEEKEEAVARAVQKYFPPGMKAEEAFELLRQLKEQGFKVGEYRHEGARNWPDGEFKPYLDEGTRRNLQRQIPKGVSKFTAKKKYDTLFSIQALLVTKHVAISFRVVDDSGVIAEVKGDIGATGI